MERLELAKWVRLDPVMREFRNVMVVGKADLITQRGPTALASMLRAAAILLKKAKRWDWLINLSASDYPLMPQDGQCVLLFLSCEIRNNFLDPVCVFLYRFLSIYNMNFGLCSSVSLGLLAVFS